MNATPLYSVWIPTTARVAEQGGLACVGATVPWPQPGLAEDGRLKR